jgi:hypothetical protein
MEYYVKIHEAEIIDNKIVISKIVIIDENNKLIREAQMNEKLLDLLKDIHTNTKYQEVKNMWEKEFGSPKDSLKTLTSR